MSNINGTGNGLANVITGNKGNNILDGKAGNDTVDGGAGSDIAVLSGKLSDYQVTVLSATSARLVDNRGIDGADTIINVERVQFADGLVDFSALKTTAVPVAGAVTVSDVTITEGNNGQTFANFVVTRAAQHLCAQLCNGQWDGGCGKRFRRQVRHASVCPGRHLADCVDCHHGR